MPDALLADDAALGSLALEVGTRLRASRRRVVTAESCTAGWVAKALTDPPGSSQWFDRGYVTYSNAAKVADLGVREDTLAAHGAVSEATVREMVHGALRRSGADVAVAITGIAGPDGGSGEKPVGTVWFAVQWRSASGVDSYAAIVARCEKFSGGREAVRRQSVATALQMLRDVADIQ